MSSLVKAFDMVFFDAVYLFGSILNRTLDLRPKLELWYRYFQCHCPQKYLDAGRAIDDPLSITDNTKSWNGNIDLNAQP